MIISFKPDLFNITEESIQNKLSRIIEYFFEQKFIWDATNIDEIFLAEIPFEDTSFYQNFLSKYEQQTITDRITQILQMEAYQTDLHNKYFNKIVVGLDECDIHPDHAYDILHHRSILILENGNNDLKFIQGVLAKYKNQKKRKGIYSLIQKAIEEHRLTEENAGGIGGILNRKDALMDREYKDIFALKVFIMFDSDRNENTSQVKQVQKNIIKVLKNNNGIENLNDCVYESNDVCPWHMLYKRGIENYLPINVIIQNIELSQQTVNSLQRLTPDEIDIYDYEPEMGRNHVDFKNEFPPLFLNNEWTRDLLEERCAHHKVKIELPNETFEEVTEIEEILIKIAKII